jgi:hypothetical protein
VPSNVFLKRQRRSAPRSGTKSSLDSSRMTTWWGCELSWRDLIGPVPVSWNFVVWHEVEKNGANLSRGTKPKVPDEYYNGRLEYQMI